MKITQEEKERGERLWRKYRWQKYRDVVKNILFAVIIIFAAVIFICVLVLCFFQKQSVDAFKVMMKPLTLEGIIFASLIFMISAAIMYLWLLLQKQENFQWFCFYFLRKDFTPYKYYALCVYNGRFIVCKIFLQTLCKTWKINLDTLIEIDLTTSQRQEGFCKDDIYKGILKVKLGFKEEEITIPLLESIFADVDAFVAETKEAIAKAIKIPLQNLGWEESARIEPEKIQKACLGIVVVVRGVCLYIEHASTPKNVAHSYIFDRSKKSNGDEAATQKIEAGLRRIVQLDREKKAKLAARESQ